MKRMLGILISASLLTACGIASTSSYQPGGSAVKVQATAGQIQPAAADQMGSTATQSPAVETTRTIEANQPAAPAAVPPASVEVPSNQATPAPCPPGSAVACRKP